MKIEDSRKNHYSYCASLERLLTFSNYSGLGLLWLFFSNNNYNDFIVVIRDDGFIFWAMVFFIASIILHLLGAIFSCIYWHFEFRTREICFYKDIDINITPNRDKLWFWFWSATFFPLDVSNIKEEELKALENKEYHVKDNVNTIPYLFFYSKMLLCILGYLFIFLKIFK